MEQYKILVDEFNHFINRFNNAEKWFNANGDKVTEKHIQELHYIIKESSIRMNMIETYRGYEVSPEESRAGIKTYNI